MKTLVFGASGATGKHVVLHLLERHHAAKIVVRESAKIPDKFLEDQNVEIIKGDIDRFSTEEIHALLVDCDSVVCCLGHNLSFKGMYGKPRKLVVNAVRKITAALAASNTPKKFVLMSTTAYTNKSHGEKNTSGEKLVFSLLEILLPPHKDNVLAANHLLYEVGASKQIEWVAVRPDGLIDEESTSHYELLENKIRSPLFDPGKTSRINVGHFMVELLVNEDLWGRWKFKTPVIYNKG
ncbi:MAG: NAD(P)-dependent oxidoreductase [Calditrichaeota bacterium]|nr:MAG: NAD(P)-dependent oxidoreductase [Calditrichota bacterium]